MRITIANKKPRASKSAQLNPTLLLLALFSIFKLYYTSKTMSATNRQPKLKLEECKRGWLLFQKEKQQVARAWICKGEKIELLSPADYAALSRAGLYEQEIPEHWRALPTGMDLQVHLRFPGQPQKETLAGGLFSALVGGYDTIITMPNTQPYLDSPEILRAALAEYSLEVSHLGDLPVRVLFTAAATQGMQGLIPTDIAGLVRTGAVAITDDGWGVKSAEAQEKIFRACAENDVLFQQHAEMHGHKGVATASAFQRQANLPEYPRSAEAEMVRRDLEILRKVPQARYHVLHVSTKESLQAIERAKQEGLRVTAEVTPHHLFFSNEDIPDDARSTFFKMNPPLFSPEDREALRAALRSGLIDCVSTDHAPHELSAKEKGWILSPFGTRGLETSLPALLSLVKAHELSWQRLEEVFSTAPRKILGRPETALPTGLLFVDPNENYLVTESDLPGISQNSCFLGQTLHGKVKIRAEKGRIYRQIS